MGRGRNLRDDDIGIIVAVLDGWTGKLTWDLLIDAIERRLRCRYTRQALDKHERIKAAFALRKAALAQSDRAASRVESPELQACLDRIARIEAENARLRLENDRLLEQFVTWAYNAHTRGLDKEFLSRPLRPIDRDRSEQVPRRK